ncbi:MAG: hypothetical protein ACRC4M_04290 [Mycoplasma sp.]
MRLWDAKGKGIELNKENGQIYLEVYTSTENKRTLKSKVLIESYDELYSYLFNKENAALQLIEEEKEIKESIIKFIESKNDVDMKKLEDCITEKEYIIEIKNVEIVIEKITALIEEIRNKVCGGLFEELEYLLNKSKKWKDNCEGELEYLLEKKEKKD